ncbi:MAG: hypothetical protein BWY39_01646 [Spirochaetes bacterium ADurb.Bin269]|nr:MAG: hypothetical protein BWY39_01646 [Spirochaetes bacterium ADurb.Bin269]
MTAKTGKELQLPVRRPDCVHRYDAFFRTAAIYSQPKVAGGLLVIS